MKDYWTSAKGTEYSKTASDRQALSMLILMLYTLSSFYNLLIQVPFPTVGFSSLIL